MIVAETLKTKYEHVTKEVLNRAVSTNIRYYSYTTSDSLPFLPPPYPIRQIIDYISLANELFK